ncbi:MAG: beta-lactamase family protein [Clostridia bacterium]|nr:beta-lactamase family protein [Clostridia bacterium]
MEKMDTFYFPRAATPEEVGVSSLEVKEFLHDCDRRGLNMHSMMVLRHGKVATECTWAPFDELIPHTMFSFSKQITAIAIGFCWSEGLLKLEDKVSKFFPSEDVKDEKIRKQNDEITVYHLITMHSGKKISVADNKEKNEWLHNWFNAPFSDAPGESFFYLSENIYILSRIVSAVTGMSMTDYLTPRLYEPLGMKVPYWEKDHNGYDAGGWGLFLTLESMAKIAQCFLQMGEFNGKQVIPADWIKLATSTHVEKIPPVFKEDLGYGFQLFIQPERYAGVYSFNGLYTQFAFIFPKEEAVFVCTAGDPHEKIFIELFWDHFPKAFIDNTDPDPEGFAALKAYQKKMADRVPPMGLRIPETEKRINGRLIKTTRRANAGVLGIGNLQNLSHRSGQIDSFCFKFDTDSLRVEFQEKNSPKAVLDVGLDGEYKFSTIHLADLDVPVASFGTWVNDSTFKLTVIPLNMAQYREFIFRFLPGNVVRVTSHAKPGLKDLFEFYLMFQGTRPGKLLNAALPVAGKGIGLVLDPNFFGVMK